MAIAVLFLALFLTAGFGASDLEELEAQAKGGDADAMFGMGSIALVAKKYPKAFEWLKKGAALNHGPSQAGLGFLYFNGFACEKDMAKARELYEKSAANGAHQGLNNLAHLYRYGLAGLEKDLPKALKLLEEAATLGNEYAVNTLAQLYMGSELGAPDPEKILRWLRFGAERNYPGCLSDLGYAYQHGIGVERDTKKAVELFTKAIAHGSAGANSNLGYLYLMGEGVDRDYPKARKLFEAAAVADDVGGIVNLAVMRYNGLGCERDKGTAFALLERAIALGNGQAKEKLRGWKAKEALPGE